MPKPRPYQLKIDAKMVEALAKIGATQDEIGSILGCSADTLQRRFSEPMKRGWDGMKLSIKRAQYDLGVNGKHATMLIWLGKQHLGQSDDAGSKAPNSSNQLESLRQAILAGPKKAEKTIAEIENEAMQAAAPIDTGLVQ